MKIRTFTLLITLVLAVFAVAGCDFFKKAEESPAPSTAESSESAESKPAESKPEESTPAVSKPEESKPEESKPDESKPEESKPGECVHEYSKNIIKPGCETEGYTEYTCTKCGHKYRDDFTKPVGHDYKETKVEPTCTEKGYTLHKCTRCQKSYKDEEVAPLGHKYTDKVVEPTCTEKGYTEHTCSVCGHKHRDTETAPKGHTYTDKVIEPTCTEKGYTEHTCSVCGHKQRDNETSPLGHDWKKVNTVAPTKTSEGYTEYECTRCKEKKIDDKTAKLPFGPEDKFFWDVEIKGDVKPGAKIEAVISLKNITPDMKVSLFGMFFRHSSNLIPLNTDEDISKHPDMSFYKEFISGSKADKFTESVSKYFASDCAYYFTYGTMLPDGALTAGDTFVITVPFKVADSVKAGDEISFEILFADEKLENAHPNQSPSADFADADGNTIDFTPENVILKKKIK